VFVTDTIFFKQRNWAKLRVVLIAPLIGGAIKRLIADGSKREPSHKNNKEKPGSLKNEAFC
jgi:hypothetical protein